MGNFYKWEMDFIRWIEQSGYDVTYSTNIDTHANGAELLNHRAFLSVGHDEYWTKEMRDAVELARDSGVSLGLLRGQYVVHADTFRILLDRRAEPRRRRIPGLSRGPTRTRCRDRRPREISAGSAVPEQTMIGIQFNFSSPQVDYVVTNSSHWVYAGTGFHDGDHVAGIVGYEADSFMSNYPPPNSTNQTLLSAVAVCRSFRRDISPRTPRSTRPPAARGSSASGSISWAWGLEDSPGIFSSSRWTRGFSRRPRTS